MAFSPEQIASLSAPLNSANVKSRTQGGSQVSYIEAYHAENEANRIFGFDGWDRETELTLLGEPRSVDGKFRVGYRAKVRITVRTPDGGKVVREGCGFGSGIDRDIDQAHESALKEAESDAEKRALKTFGNPFGQALYDKSKSEVVDVAAQERAEAAARAKSEGDPALCETSIAGLESITDGPGLVVWWGNNAKSLKANLNAEQWARVEKTKNDMKAKIEKGELVNA